MVTRILGDNPNIQMSHFEAQCPKGSSKIALVVDESDDYHFLRQDKTRFWSHKPGARKVTDKDASSHRIWDPQLCDMNYTNHEGVLNYDIFCGYMCVPRDKPLFLRVGGGKKGAAAAAAEADSDLSYL